MHAKLDARHVALIEGPVSIHVASRNGLNAPSVGRAIGCRIARDGRIAAFLSASQARSVIDDISACGRVAVVFSRPSTHETIQLKGDDARLEAIVDDDLAHIGDYVDRFVEEIHSIGFPRELGRTILHYEATDVVAVAFTPQAAYRQTPGPNAGAPLGQ